MKGISNLNQIVTLKSAHKKDGRKLHPSDLDVITDGTVIYDENEIVWVGESCNLPKMYSSVEFRDGTGLILTPEIVDSHTHLVFAGNRAFEYTMRLDGADYQDIADAGGGILSTVSNTNEADIEKLFTTAVERIKRIHSYGIGTIEIKSGYALNYKKEKEVTLLINRLKKHFAPKVQIINTYMAAHAVPKGFDSSTQYINEICIPLMNDLAPMGVIDFVDVFHEKGYFEKSDVILLAKAAKNLGLGLKTHSDEFNDNKGAILACELKAVSCDHLLCTKDDGIKSLAKNDTVATLLPGTGFFLGKKQANARALLDGGAKVALASDYNPGSCHCDNLILIAALSAAHLKLNSAELWSAITLNSSHALGLKKQGAIIEGLHPRFSFFKAKTFDEITYNWGINLNSGFPGLL